MPDPFYLGMLRQITQNAPDMPLADRQRLASMGRYAQSEGVDIGMYGDRDEEGYGMMLDDLMARQKPAAQPKAPAAKAQPQQSFAPQMEMSPVWNPYQQASLLQNAANQTMGAWSNELDSRVAQSREMRRMQHEQYLKGMERDALLKRLEMEQQMMREKMMMESRQNRIASDRKAGIISSTNWNNPNYF